MPRAARGKSFKPGTAIHWSQKAAYSDIDCRDFAPRSLSLILLSRFRLSGWNMTQEGHGGADVQRH